MSETYVGRISIVSFLTAATTGLVYGSMFGPPSGGEVILGFLLSVLYAIVLWVPCVLIWSKYFPLLKVRVGVTYSATILATIFGFISPLPFWLIAGLDFFGEHAIQLSVVYHLFTLILFALMFGILPAAIGGILGFILFRKV